MGCGKSKHDVVSGNIILQCKKSYVSSQESVMETKDTNNNHVDNVISEPQVKQKENESVKEFKQEVLKDDIVNDLNDEVEKTNVQKEKEGKKTTVQEEKEIGSKGGEGKSQETIVAKGQSEISEGEKNGSKENEQKSNNAYTTTDVEEKIPIENKIEDVDMMEEEIKDTKVSTFKGEEKYLKLEEIKNKENLTII